MASEHNGSGWRWGVVALVVAFVAYSIVSSRTFRPRRQLGPDVRISKGMPLNAALALMKQHGVIVKGGQGAVDVPDAVDFQFYNLPTRKAIDVIEIFAKQLKDEEELFIRALRLYPWHDYKPHQWQGEKYLHFESLSLDDILLFQDRGIEPAGVQEGDG
jgi:hypothetical protein